MTRALLPPVTDREVETLKKRVTDLERVLRRIERSYKPGPLFSYSGVLAVASSGRWYSRTGGRLISILWSIDTPGETGTVLELHKNGTLLREVEIPAGVEKLATNLSEPMVPDGDYLTLRIATAGAGAADLVSQGELL